MTSSHAGVTRATRARLLYLGLAVATIAVGLAVHYHGRPLIGLDARDITGDALWGAMMVWWVSLVSPGSRRTTRAGVALAICFAVELSQLVRAPWIDALRHSSIGHLVLGSGFDPRDFFAYTAGVVVAALIDRRLRPTH